MTMRLGWHLFVALIALGAVRGTEPGMAAIPEAIYRPLFRGGEGRKGSPHRCISTRRAAGDEWRVPRLRARESEMAAFAGEAAFCRRALSRALGG